MFPQASDEDQPANDIPPHYLTTHQALGAFNLQIH